MLHLIVLCHLKRENRTNYDCTEWPLSWLVLHQTLLCYLSSCFSLISLFIYYLLLAELLCCDYFIKMLPLMSPSLPPPTAADVILTISTWLRDQLSFKLVNNGINQVWSAQIHVRMPAPLHARTSCPYAYELAPRVHQFRLKRCTLYFDSVASILRFKRYN